VRKSKGIDAFKCEYAVNVSQKLSPSFYLPSCQFYSRNVWGGAGTTVDFIPHFKVRPDSTGDP